MMTGTHLYVGSGANNTGNQNPIEKFMKYTLGSAFNLSSATERQDTLPCDSDGYYTNWYHI